ncbi:hypothetical protein HDV00_012742 [Rhizophlyctis rosea]|nr:hypothetical protein HDV00_012742 [Rhizophlyctis rosea]
MGVTKCFSSVERCNAWNGNFCTSYKAAASYGTGFTSTAPISRPAAAPTASASKPIITAGGGVGYKPEYLQLKPKAASSSPAPKATTPAPTPAKDAATAFPESLKDYLRRAFEAVKKPEKRQAVEEQLRRTIEEYKAKGTIGCELNGEEEKSKAKPSGKTKFEMKKVAPSLKANVFDSTAAAVTKKMDAVNLVKQSDDSMAISTSRSPSPTFTIDTTGNDKKRKSRFLSTSPNLTKLSSPALASDSDDAAEPDDILKKLPPSQRNAELAKRAERAKRFKTANDAVQKVKMEKRRQSERAKEAFLAAGAEGNPDVIDWDEYTIVGTSQDLEKRYLRLTSAPDPANVRPLPVLRKTLQLLTDKWKNERNYTYICDQFKSLRQDLTVQRIKNDFTVNVYEIHARIALEKGDLGEYNQCQSQLMQLYSVFNGNMGNVDEFLGYRILYLILTLNRSELVKLLGTLTESEKRGPCVSHALNVRTSITIGNYHRLFTLFNEAPKMSQWLMDHFVERERVKAMKVICRAYRPSVPLDFVAKELGFLAGGGEGGDGMKEREGKGECWGWLVGKGCPFVADRGGGNGAGGGGGGTKVFPRDAEPADADLEGCFVDCKGALAVFVEHLRVVMARGVDLKGQIH